MAWIRACGGGSPAVPDGKTITPINDVTIWQQCAGIANPTYVTLSDILADVGVLSVLMASDNAVDYLVRSKLLIGNTALVPTMTSDNTPSGVCFASTVHLTDSAYKAFDGNDSTTWESANNSVTDEYIGYEFAQAVFVSSISIRSSLAAAKQPKNYKLQGSNDGVTYTDIPDIYGNVTLNGFNGSSTSTTATHTFNNGTKYQYYRLFIGTNWGGANIDVTTLQFGFDGVTTNANAMYYIGQNNYASNTLLADSDWRDAIVNSTYWDSVLNDIVPIMTDDTHPSGECFASSVFSASYPAWKAFDGDTIAQGWGSGNGTGAGQYCGYKFTSQKDIYVYKAQDSNNRMTSIKFQGSNNGSSWADISPALTTKDNRWFSYKTTNPTKYQYYRMYVNAVSQNNVGVTEIQFYGREDV